MQRTLAILRRLLASGYWWTLFAIGVALPAADAHGDGGTLQLSQRCGNFQVSVFTSPSVLRAGPIDVSVFLQDAATGEIRADVPVTIHLECVDKPEAKLEQSATSAAATNRLFQAALFDVPVAGVWRATVTLPDVKSALPFSFNLAIALPLPPWLQLTPWIGWPFVVVALFVVHQRLAAQCTRHAPP